MIAASPCPTSRKVAENVEPSGGLAADSLAAAEDVIAPEEDVPLDTEDCATDERLIFAEDVLDGFVLPEQPAAMRPSAARTMRSMASAAAAPGFLMFCPSAVDFRCMLLSILHRSCF